MEEYYLIKFKPTPRAELSVVGCLRFQGKPAYEQRQEALKKWQAKHRPNQPELEPGETMYLVPVTVEDA